MECLGTVIQWKSPPSVLFPVINLIKPCNQWPFQEPKLEVPTIYKIYVSGLFQGMYPFFFYGPKYGADSSSILGSWRSPIDHFSDHSITIVIGFVFMGVYPLVI